MSGSPSLRTRVGPQVRPRGSRCTRADLRGQRAPRPSGYDESMPSKDAPIHRAWTRRRALTALGITGAAAAGLAACTSKSDSPTLVTPSGTKPAEVKNGKATVTISNPAPGATDV